MEELNDIKFGVMNKFGEIVGFFEDEHFAQNLIDAQGCPEDYKIIKGDDDFYIDIHIEISSSFDVRG